MNFVNRSIALVVTVVCLSSWMGIARAEERPTPRPVSRLALFQVDDTAPTAAAAPAAQSETPPAIRDFGGQQAAQPKPVAKEAEDAPAYKKWWFWVLTAAVIGGTVALGSWAAKPTDQPAHPCTTGVRACFGDGRP